MRWLAILGILFGFYYYFLMHTTSLVMDQLQNVQNQYTYVANHADQIATGR